MKKAKFALIIILLLGVFGFYLLKEQSEKVNESNILSYEVNPNTQELKFYWKDQEGKNYANFQHLKTALGEENKKLIFAMNGGMYNKDLSPQGLYVENGITQAPIDTIKNGYGNFYLQPNGIFYLTKDNQPAICITDNFVNNGKIEYATQSGPMLLIEGKMHPKFNEGSKNMHIRNGVGILPNGNLLFAMSKEKTNFYDFTSYFKEKGCKNALYLDGFVSRAYLPSKNWEQLEGNFGVIIGETRK